MLKQEGKSWVPHVVTGFWLCKAVTLLSVISALLISASQQPIKIFISWPTHLRTCVTLWPWSHSDYSLCFLCECLHQVGYSDIFSFNVASCDFCLTATNAMWDRITWVYSAGRRLQHRLILVLYRWHHQHPANLQSMRKKVRDTSVQGRKHLASF